MHTAFFAINLYTLTYKWVKRFRIYVEVLAMIIFIWTCQMEFSSFSSYTTFCFISLFFTHYTYGIEALEACRMRRFWRTFFRGFGSRHRFSFLTLRFLASRCLLTAFRYRQGANIDERNFQWKMGQLGEVYSACSLSAIFKIALQLKIRERMQLKERRINFSGIIKLEHILYVRSR